MIGVTRRIERLVRTFLVGEVTEVKLCEAQILSLPDPISNNFCVLVPGIPYSGSEAKVAGSFRNNIDHWAPQTHANVCVTVDFTISGFPSPNFRS